MKRLLTAITRIAAMVAAAVMLASCGAGRQAVTVPEGDWAYLSMPVKVKLTEPERLTATGRITMERGRAIELSLRAMGMEVAVAYIDPDTVVVADKYNDRYLAMPFAPVTRTTGLDIASLQDALIGFYPDAPAMPEGRTFMLDADNSSLRVVYGAPAETDGIRLASRTDLDLRSRLRAVAALAWQTSKARWNRRTTLKPPSVKGMTRIEPDDEAL